MQLNYVHHEHHKHYEHPYFNKYAINTFVAHISFLCYTVFHFYMLLETRDKNFINNKIIYSNKPQLTFLIKTKLKMVFQEEMFFRVFLVEIMSLFMDHCYIHTIWCLIFAYYYYNTYKYNIFIRIANFINIFIVSYFVLINVSLISSLAIHCYLELFAITFNFFLYSNFRIKITNGQNNSLNNSLNKIKLPDIVKAVINKHEHEHDNNNQDNQNQDNQYQDNQSEHNQSEFASKEEVEALLSNKKMD